MQNSEDLLSACRGYEKEVCHRVGTAHFWHTNSPGDIIL